MRTKKRGRETGTGTWDLGSRVGLSCWSCAYDRDSCHVSGRGNQSAPTACRSCTQPLLRTGPALSDAHTEPRKTCSWLQGFCNSAVRKREFVQPRPRQNSKFTDETVFKRRCLPTNGSQFENIIDKFFFLKREEEAWVYKTVLGSFEFLFRFQKMNLNSSCLQNRVIFGGMA